LSIAHVLQGSLFVLHLLHVAFVPLFLLLLLLLLLLLTCIADVLQRIAAGLSAQGLRVDSTVTLACGDVLWVAEHKITRAR
jgi:hypothetical protein